MILLVLCQLPSTKLAENVRLLWYPCRVFRAL